MRMFGNLNDAMSLVEMTLTSYKYPTNSNGTSPRYWTQRTKREQRGLNIRADLKIGANAFNQWLKMENQPNHAPFQSIKNRVVNSQSPKWRLEMTVCIFWGLHVRVLGMNEFQFTRYCDKTLWSENSPGTWTIIALTIRYRRINSKWSSRIFLVDMTCMSYYDNYIANQQGNSLRKYTIYLRDSTIINLHSFII